ncbi:MAG: DUF1343 domain-containing protein [Pleomorphochaeta sp.]
MFTYSIDKLLISNIKFDGKVALVTNNSAYNNNYNSTFTLLKEKYDIKTLFAPEHGFNSVKMAGENVENITDTKNNIIIYSLYNNGSFSLNENMLNSFDTLLFDIQDLGLRFYTYISTLKKIIISLSNTNKKLVVLDRPAILNGNKVEGNILNENDESFIGPKGLPIRYGLTIGELALLFNDQNNNKCDLEIITMDNYNRKLDISNYNIPWIKPSPAITSFNTALLYSGTCLFEGTNISVARGTYSPFEMIGSPFLDGIKLSKQINNLKLPGLITTPIQFLPKFNKYENEICNGVYFHVTDINKCEIVYSTIKILIYLYKNYPSFILDDSKTSHTSKLLGYNFEKDINSYSANQLIEKYKEESHKFKIDSNKYYLY